jgi:hypothetical protein
LRALFLLDEIGLVVWLSVNIVKLEVDESLESKSKGIFRSCSVLLFLLLFGSFVPSEGVDEFSPLFISRAFRVDEFSPLWGSMKNEDVLLTLELSLDTPLRMSVKSLSIELSLDIPLRESSNKLEDELSIESFREARSNNPETES